VSKNLIYMTAVNHDTSTYRNSDYAKYAKMSWKHWCKKRGIDFLVIDEHNPRYKFPVWNKDRFIGTLLIHLICMMMNGVGSKTMQI